MDGIGPVRSTDARVFTNPAVWERDEKHKKHAKPSDAEDEVLEEDETTDPEKPEDHHIDLEA